MIRETKMTKYDGFFKRRKGNIERETIGKGQEPFIKKGRSRRERRKSKTREIKILI